MSSERETLTIGFIPLVDCAVVVAARDKGFAEAEGLTLDLVRETSWANIRDRVVLGHFDAAQMLAPMPIAANLGIGGFDAPMVAPFSLGLGGNAITVSTALFAAMRDHGADDAAGPAAMAAALAASIAARRKGAAPLLTFGMVHPFSCHNYELRYWLASAGIDPDRDVRLTVVPPPMMVEALREGRVDGFCVGEPWNSQAVDEAVGHIVAVKSALWRQSPEKVLGLRTVFADQRPATVDALLRALHRAAAWAGSPAHHAELAEMLARPDRVGAPAGQILRALSGRLVAAPGAPPAAFADFLVFHAHAASFPWQSHALWLYSQMARWGQVAHTPERAAVARATYRPDIFRRALGPVGADLPAASAKVEGALTRPTPVASLSGRLVLGPDGFFDGRLFDPDDLDGYLRGVGVAV
jgi:ABC-type nitrate/sulfonate/bicarbonate transport system substrate-binding protein